MGNNIRSSSRPKALAPSIPMPPLADAMDAVHLSVDRFCLLAGVEALAEMMEEDATTVCGARHRRHGDRRGYRWGRTPSEIGYHGGKVKVARPRVRDRAGKEVSLESWQALRDGNLLLEWALNLMVLNVSTRKYHRAVRLPEGDLAKARGDGTSKSAVSRRFVALSRKKMKAWLASDLSELDLLVIQIDGLHVGDHVLMAAIGVDGNGDKHVLAVVEGATENTVVVQALIDNLLARGLDPTLPRLFIVDGAKALSKAIRNTFGVAAAIQRCQVHKGRNIIERRPSKTNRNRPQCKHAHKYLQRFSARHSGVSPKFAMWLTTVTQPCRGVLHTRFLVLSRITSGLSVRPGVRPISKFVTQPGDVVPNQIVRENCRGLCHRAHSLQRADSL